MTRAQALALLRGGAEGVQRWNRARESDRPLLKLSYVNLAEADLSGADLTGVDLHASNFRGAILVRAKLTGANLRRCHLLSADLSHADLRSADLHAANLRHVNLIATDLRNANLHRAWFRNATSDTSTLWPDGLVVADHERSAMTEADRAKYLRVVLLLVGLTFTVGIYPLTIIWPSGWAWHTGQSDYLQMILGIYATLGVFLIVASRNPLAHRSLIWFTVWSSVVHGGIMAVQSVANPQHIGHLWGDVLALFLVAAALAFLMVRLSPDRSERHTQPG